MIRVTLQLPQDPDRAIVEQLERAAEAVASGKGDERFHLSVAPADTYSLTVQVLPDPATP